LKDDYSSEGMLCLN